MNAKRLDIPLMAVAVLTLSVMSSPATQARPPGFLSQKVLQETYDLSHFPGQEVVVLMDTTNVNDIVSGHVVATLPNEDSTCDEGESPYPGLLIGVGAADNTGGDNPAHLVFPIPENTGIGMGREVSFAGDNVATCVFHLDIAPGLTDGENTVSIITDIAFINTACSEPNGGGDPEACDDQKDKFDSMPEGTSIGVTVKIGNTVSTDAPTP
ncbi:hypothetical protein [Nitrosococcus wardiae]|uniref:Uncharacterized protein n=1 Tax=Nitrosococcus wardiae TaxID=1814290 RepID=A0A4P7C2N3_9GAMM|nr:hypothetical protein [Nitrosococcus wardiae]QBQ55152.1 hypothetical protein E3U44_12015 [Nitrosococcus wardiae]